MPLRRVWGPGQNKVLSTLPTLKYFDGKDPIVIQCDV